MVGWNPPGLLFLPPASFLVLFDSFVGWLQQCPSGHAYSKAKRKLKTNKKGRNERLGSLNWDVKTLAMKNVVETARNEKER